MSGRLVQISGIVVDLVYAIRDLPASGGEEEATDAFMAAGGGFNAMLAAKRAGAEVVYGGALGNGRFAEMATAALQEEGIPCLPSPRKSIDQGSCVVLVDVNGERSFVSHHGAERQVEIADLDALALADDDWILLSGYGLYHRRSTEAFGAWLRRLPRGPRLLFDPGPMVPQIPRPALNAALDRADWISANRWEAQAMTGYADAADSSPSLAIGRAGALVRDGAEGCWLGAPGAPARRIKGFAVEAVDTTGAGDAHDGAFIAALLYGCPPRVAASFANAAAALSTTRRGPATAPHLAEIRAFVTARGADAGAFPEVRPPSEATLSNRL